jgi:hypothetical protein
MKYALQLEEFSKFQLYRSARIKDNFLAINFGNFDIRHGEGKGTLVKL